MKTHLKVIFVNEIPPDNNQIAAFRMGELANAMARQGHQIILLTTANHKDEITDCSTINFLIAQHDWSVPLGIRSGRNKSFWLKKLRSGKLPKLLSKALVFFYYLFSYGVVRDWKQSVKPFLKPLAKNFSPDIVIGTFGNTDCLMITRQIALYAKAPFVIDLKDAWCNFIPFLFQGYCARRFQDAAMITALSKFYMKDAETWFAFIPRRVIYSGFSEKLLENVNKSNIFSPQTFKIFLVGSHYNRTHLRILLNGIQLWAEKINNPKINVELHYD